MTTAWVEINPKGVTVAPEHGKRILVRYVLGGVVGYCIIRYREHLGQFTKHDTHWCYITPPEGEKE